MFLSLFYKFIVDAKSSSHNLLGFQVESSTHVITALIDILKKEMDPK